MHIVSFVSHNTVVILYTLEDKMTGVEVQSIQMIYIIFTTTFT